MAKKRSYNIDELLALRSAYGNPARKSELIASSAKPFFVTAVFTFLLTYYWWVALICGLIAGFYGYKVITPLSITRAYADARFRQINKFINTMTSILVDKGKTVEMALSRVIPRLSGEFKEDVKKLLARLVGRDDADRDRAFELFHEKYQDDVILDLYIEQLHTADIEGRRPATMAALKDIENYHNGLAQQRHLFLRDKEQKAKEFRFMCRLSIGLIVVISFSFGLPAYIQAFAHTWIGWVTTAVYLFLFGAFFRQYVRRMADDNLLEVKV